MLLHLVSGQYHGLNPVGLAVWEIIEQSCTVAQLVARLRDRIDGPPPTLESDVLQFLDGARERELIVVEP